jgi:hypothetical protein
MEERAKSKRLGCSTWSKARRVALARLGGLGRAKKLSPKRRAEIAMLGGAATKAKFQAMRDEAAA